MKKKISEDKDLFLFKQICIKNKIKEGIWVKDLANNGKTYYWYLNFSRVTQ